ncbi:TPA: hypothetical protein EYP12_03560, partial [Candidatus Bipolaricaulota bacterium]|nr:hypothetical protein [Candidatus Bipolaricaulota bacterium]
MVRSVGFFKGVCLTAAFMAALLSFPEIASGKKEPMAGKARGVDVKARTVAAKIGMARGTWRVPFNALAQREQRKLDRPLRAMVRIPDNVKLGFYYAKNYGIELEGEEPIFHITVVTDGSTIEIEDLGLKLRPFVGDMFSTTATFQQILALAKLRNVVRIELCERFKPLLDESVPKTSANMAHALEYSSGTTNDGEGVIVGIVDSGIDWSHEDFIDDNTGTSRILFIWDQVDSTEYTQADINDEIDGTPVGYVAEVDEDGHGTHVAGIAAGDGSAGSYPGKYTGMAPKADLIVFKLNQWTRDEIRDGVA